MANEYFKFGDQTFFEFNEEKLTFTIVSADEKVKNIQVDQKNELDYQGTLYTFKGNVLRSLQAEELKIAPPHFLNSTEEEFNEKKQIVKDYIANL